MNVTKNQHFVWRHYLEAWARSGKIKCLMGHGIFNPSLKNVGVGRYFYEISELSAGDFDYLIKLVESSPHKELQDLNFNTIRVAKHVSDASKRLREARSQGVDVSELEKVLTKSKRMLFEKYHGSIENRATEFLSSLRAKKNRLYEW